MAKFEDILKSAKLPEDSVPICLRGDLTLQHEGLERQLAQAEEADKGNSLASGGQARKIAEQVADLEQKMQDYTHDFAFRGLPRDAYRELLAEHPPRKDNQPDEMMGANLQTFPVALIAATCIDPVMTEEQVEQLAQVVTDGSLNAMFGCTLALNRLTVDLPKSVLASEILRSTVRNSKQPAPGGSPAAASTGGNLNG